jgi:hypothetical protein
MIEVKPQRPNLLFGQFLVEKKVITSDTLMLALKKQSQEKSDIMIKSERLLGQILIDDFEAFDRLELVKLLKEFGEYKLAMENEFHLLKRLSSS